MSFKCFAENCTTQPVCYCDCIENFSFMCQNHFFVHINENEKLKHPIQVIYSKIDPETKDIKLKEFSDLIETMKIIESNIHNSLSGIINALNNLQTECIKYFREQRLVINQTMESLEKEDKEIIVSGYQTQSFAFENYAAHLSSVNSDIQSLCDTITECIGKREKKFKCHKEFYNFDEINYYNNGALDEHLYCFQIGTKNLIEFNTLTNLKRTIQVNVNENQGSLAPTCQIPGNKLFYSGGYSPHLDTSYLIDLKTFTVEQLPKLRQRGITTATYYKQCVYIFGGYTGKTHLENADKFDLIKKQWVCLSPLPNISGDMHVLIYRSYFLMTYIRNSSLLKYYLDKNSYEAIGSLKYGSNHSIIRDCQKIYLINENTLYLSNENNFNEWALIKSLSQSLYQNTSKPVTRKREVFMFSIHYNKIWKFNLDSLDLILIGTII